MVSVQPQDMVEEGERKLRQWWSFPGTNKWEEAADLFVTAAHLFKVGKNWRDAGNAFLRAADCFGKQRALQEQATNIAEAAGCFRKGGAVLEALMCYERAVNHYTDLGRWATVGKYERETADFLVAEFQFSNALVHYGRAAAHYSREDLTDGHTNCLLAMANIHADKGEWVDAAALFEEAAEAFGRSRLLAPQVKDCLLRAMLCHVAWAARGIDPESLTTARVAAGKYKTGNPQYGARESELASQLLNAVETRNPDAVAQCVDMYGVLRDQRATWVTVIRMSLRPPIDTQLERPHTTHHDSNVLNDTSVDVTE